MSASDCTAVGLQVVSQLAIVTPEDGRGLCFLQESTIHGCGQELLEIADQVIILT